MRANAESVVPGAETAGFASRTADGRLPADLTDDEQRAWRLARQLTAEGRIDQPAYDEARAAFGERGIADLLLLVGAVQTVCGLPNGFEIPAPGAGTRG